MWLHNRVEDEPLAVLITWDRPCGQLSPFGRRRDLGVDLDGVSHLVGWGHSQGRYTCSDVGDSAHRRRRRSVASLMLAGTVDQDAIKQPKADYPLGRRNRYSLAWNGGFEKVSKFC